MATPPDALVRPANPYVGPRSLQAGERLYGRDREARELIGLLVAERIVLLYSPSGAGKSSLVQAALIPRLAQRDFFVRPVVRVNLVPAAPGNRYLLSTLIALEEALPADAQLPLAELAGLSLDAYLRRRPPPPEADGEVLVFDQFEEVLTVDPTDEAQKQAFFAELGAALRDRDRWALFAMREDYVAALDPYAHHIPTRLSSTFRLDLLGLAAARAVMRGPAQDAGVAFADEAAARLVADLSRVLVQRPDGSLEEQPGLTVEPVQLQVVCYRLWERLPPGASRIGLDEVAGLGDVNRALADYYAERVAQAAAASGVSERAIREWFDRRLITPQGIRGTVLQGAGEGQGLPAAAVRPLVDAYLVRGEKRRGATWLELAHDRLVAPVRADNSAWFAAHLSTLQRQADLWEQQGRPAGLLLRDEALAEAEAWAEANQPQLTPAERDFLQLCREARAALERERRQARRIRRLAIGAATLAAVALVAFVVAWGFYLRSEGERRLNRARQLAAAAVSNLPVDPERSVLLAREAAVATDAPLPVALDALQQAAQRSRVERTLRGHGAGVTGASFAPDGAAVATAGNDGTLRVWPLDGGEPVVIDAGADLLDLAFSPGGRLIVACDIEGAVRAWEPGGAERWSLTTDEGPGRLAFSPDGGRLAVALESGAVLLLSAEDGADLARLTLSVEGDEDPPPIYDVAFSPDGSSLVAGDGLGGVTLWDVASGEAAPLPSQHAEAVEAVAWSPDGASLASAGSDGRLLIWDARGRRVRAGAAIAAGFYDVAFSPDSQLLATGGADGAARVWTLAGGAPLLSLDGHGDYVFAVSWGPGGRRLLTGSLDATARIWSLALVPPDGAASVALSPDGARLASGGLGTVRQWDLADGAQTGVLPGAVEGGAVRALAWSPNGARLAAAIETVVQVWDAASGEELALLAGHEGDINGLAWSPDGALLATASEDGTVRVWDAASGEERYAAGGHDDWVVGLAWSPDGARLAGCDRLGVIVVREAATGAPVTTIELPGRAECNALAWSPDGARVASADTAGAAVVWDAATGAELLRVAHPPEVRDVTFSPDGSLLYTAGRDRRVLAWGAATGAPAALAITLPAEPDEIQLSGDGALLAAASADNLPRVYPLTTGALLALAESRATRGPTEEECAAYGPLAGCSVDPGERW